MKTRITLIAAAVASLFVGIQPAMAVSATHEGEWDKVKLCANVTVASDSADSWGCWTELAPTAAGPAGVGLLGMPGGDAYRNIPGYTLPEEGCPAGAVCGYAVYRNFTSNYVDGWLEPHWDTVWHPGHFEGSGWHKHWVPGYSEQVYDPIWHPPRWDINYEEGGDSSTHVFPATFFVTPGDEGETLNYGLQSLNGSDPPPMYSTSGTLDAMSFLNHWYADNGDTSPLALIDGQDIYLPVQTGWRRVWFFGWHWVPVYDGSEYAYSRGDERDALNEFKIFEYTSGMTVMRTEGPSDPGAGVEGNFIVGVTTPADFMGRLSMNNVNATYSGSEFSYNSDVNINVQFGSGTWNGTWNRTGSSRDFQAAGTIQGANIQSTGVTGYRGSQVQSGMVQGSFYGSQAQALGGVSDVTFNSGARTVDLFTTIRTDPLPQSMFPTTQPSPE